VALNTITHQVKKNNITAENMINGKRIILKSCEAIKEVS